MNILGVITTSLLLAASIAQAGTVKCPTNQPEIAHCNLMAMAVDGQFEASPFPIEAVLCATDPQFNKVSFLSKASVGAAQKTNFLRKGQYYVASSGGVTSILTVDKKSNRLEIAEKNANSEYKAEFACLYW